MYPGCKIKTHLKLDVRSCLALNLFHVPFLIIDAKLSFACKKEFHRRMLAYNKWQERNRMLTDSKVVKAEVTGLKTSFLILACMIYLIGYQTFDHQVPYLMY